MARRRRQGEKRAMIKGNKERRGQGEKGSRREEGQGEKRARRKEIKEGRWQGEEVKERRGQ